ncbi:hypothetical protein [Paraglaciecola sp.]|uniref:hypothetical protein n=1 Tax=Paraglaciecola sp. TaxID=1920173 RepID=UPI003EF59BAD
MTNNIDPLNQLWQQQSVEKPDVLVTKKQWKNTQLKHRMYALLDILSLVLPFGFVLFYADKLDSFTRILLICVFALCVPFVAYLIWLRRFAIGWSSSDTEQHIQKLRKQITNNIKIAFVTKHSVWPSTLMPVVHLGGLYYLNILPLEKIMAKAPYSIAILVVVLPIVWIWANKRQNRFINDLAKLNQLLDTGSIK